MYRSTLGQVSVALGQYHKSAGVTRGVPPSRTRSLNLPRVLIHLHAPGPAGLARLTILMRDVHGVLM